jgi:hypothetical protein
VRELGAERGFGDHLRAETLRRLVLTGRWAEAETMLRDPSDGRMYGTTALVRESAIALLRAEQGDISAAEHAATAASEAGAGTRGLYWTATIALGRATSSCGLAGRMVPRVQCPVVSTIRRNRW